MDRADQEQGSQPRGPGSVTKLLRQLDDAHARLDDAQAQIASVQSKLTERYLKNVRRLARTVLQKKYLKVDDQDLEFVAGQVFTELVKRSHQLPNRGALEGWLLKAAGQRAIDQARRHKPLKTESALGERGTANVTDQGAQVPSDELEASELFAKLAVAIAMLRPSLRQAYKLRHHINTVHEMKVTDPEPASYEEVGACLGIGGEAARLRVKKAEETLKANLHALGVDDDDV